jgi:hypothetical protein
MAFYYQKNKLQNISEPQNRYAMSTTVQYGSYIIYKWKTCTT